jgi:predicted DNA-binding transcriptional regulator AlpA
MLSGSVVETNLCLTDEWIRAVSIGKRKLSNGEIRRAFVEGAQVPVILSPSQFGAFLGISQKTVYEWIGKGRLDGAFRKRGKHILIWRDRAIDVLFNGKEWSDV